MDEPDDDRLDRWTSTVVLGDGTSAVIRPIRPSDAAALAAFHSRQSSESKYRRFFSPKPELSATELERFTCVDFVDRVAFVVEEHDEMLAWGSYERWKNRRDAEVAFMVDDEHQGRGIATLLLEHLAAVAGQNGITRFTAQTLGDNRGMLAVFAKAGWPLHRRFESGVIDVDFELAETTEFVDSVERREQRADSRAVARLLLPASIAVVGASDEPQSIGRALWENIVADADASRPVHAVNPAHETVGGARSYPTVEAIPDEVGLAVIAVPGPALRGVVDACIAKRVRGAVVITAIDWPDDEIDALVSHARRNGLRLVGPASMGIASPRPEVALQAALVRVDLPPGHVAVSMQSGSLGGSVLRLAEELRLGLSWFVSLGDKSDVSANDLLQFWEDDDATAVIALYTESLGNPRKFARIAGRVSASKPIVAVRTGAALLGAASAALYRQTGLIEVPTVTSLLDTARVFATQPLMAGDRVAVVSNARSPEVLARATLEGAGLEAVDVTSELDWSSAGPDYEDLLRSTFARDDVDAVMVIYAPPVADAVGRPVDAIEAAATGQDKPVVAVMLGAGDGPLRAGSRIPCFAFPEQAAAALGRVAAYSRWRAEETGDELAPPARIDAVRARRLLLSHAATGTMPPGTLRELLAAYGVEMPVSRLVPAAEAPAAADEIGYPVAVKALHRGVGRSVEAGVALDLSETDDVVEAVDLMRTHLGDDAEHVLVQHMVRPGVDMRIQVTVDDRIGPVITTGLGGVHAEVIGDESSRLAPISPSSARTLVIATRAAALLDDDGVERFADTITRVAQLASDHAQLRRLDLNPVIVSTDGCYVVDATISIAEPARPEPAVRRLE